MRSIGIEETPAAFLEALLLTEERRNSVGSFESEAKDDDKKERLISSLVGLY